MGFFLSADEDEDDDDDDDDYASLGMLLFVCILACASILHTHASVVSWRVLLSYKCMCPSFHLAHTHMHGCFGMLHEASVLHLRCVVSACMVSCMYAVACMGLHVWGCMYGVVAGRLDVVLGACSWALSDPFLATLHTHTPIHMYLCIYSYNCRHADADSEV